MVIGCVRPSNRLTDRPTSQQKNKQTNMPKPVACNAAKVESDDLLVQNMQSVSVSSP